MTHVQQNARREGRTMNPVDQIRLVSAILKHLGDQGVGGCEPRHLTRRGKNMDIIVTTPKSQMANAAQEAADCIKDGGGQYFRRLPRFTNIQRGDRVYYVEDGYVRGFAVVSRIEWGHRLCETTGRQWPDGMYAVMDAASWQWIKPIPMRGFQGYHCAQFERGEVAVIGGWKDPRPITGGIRAF